MTHIDGSDQRGAKPRQTLSTLLYSKSFRTAVTQVVMAAVVIFIGLFLYQNVVENLRAQNIATGFGFLEQTSQFDIGEKMITYSARDSYGRAFVVGLLNTLSVSAAGIFLATLIGFTVGISRISSNWLLSKVATGYVEIVRNIPVILQVIFWSVLLRNLPNARNAVEMYGVGFLTNRGLTFAVPATHPIHSTMGIALVAGIVLAILGSIWARRHRESTGTYVNMLWPSIGLIIGLPVLVWLFGGAPTAISYPVQKGFNFQGGVTISPEFTALLIGIALYASGFIAEIVRAGLQATPKGQIEAARSMGFRPWFVTRYVVLPQALRVIVPPLTSQYVSLIKNSSIAVVVGYPDLVNIGNTVMNQTGQAVEAIAVMMLVYLTISLITSTFMNFYNRLVAIKER
ncbi:amino acid ABC transporter membrane protein 1, PAAT family [Celeribacter baekdonensis]|uniref:Amino acid ABC transporter membrane protein 1, PAAT family n=1 Tax=Celeribacter baekdonensis TaxID=875171 RepID=A0A1G7MFI5_9RHOB|nr:ABC transporter permease subunit [Celeribacter baekdonensis]SDF60461.1 amino acid ABC transporter membrane protein 1, PAAT family [Celeribacter baekdonensis]